MEDRWLQTAQGKMERETGASGVPRRQRKQRWCPEGSGFRKTEPRAAEVASMLYTVVKQVDPPVANETEECGRPQSTSKGGKHDLRARWAANGVGSEAHMSFVCGWDTVRMCTVYPQVRLALETGDSCMHSCPSACTDQEGGEEMDSREQDCPALAPCILDPPKGGFLRCYGVPLTGGVGHKELGALAEP